MDVSEAVKLLWASLMLSGHEDLAKRLNERMEVPELVYVLTKLEREVRNAQVHRAVALLKSAIGGKRTFEEFERQCLKIQGLV